MQHLIKKYLWLVFLAAGLPSAWGFATGQGLGGGANKADAWETAALGYDYAYTSFADYPGGPIYLGDIDDPANLNLEYRRNIPIIFYAYDASFLNYFGSNGVAAVDSAVAIMNSLPPADQIDYTQFPMDSQNFNYLAQSLYLTDLKSTTLHLLVEQLGLVQPERYTWAMHDRAGGTPCPLAVTYLIVQRNFQFPDFNPLLANYSSYVNNVLYTYNIVENCQGAPLAYTVPISVDPLADQYTAVADSSYDTYGGLQIGGYYNGLTQDDAMGIDYLLTTNHINREVVTGSDLLTATTNYAAGEVLFPANANITTGGAVGYGTFNLGTLLQTAVTTAPANLPALFPGLVVANSVYYYTTTNIPTVTAAYVPPGNGYPYGSALKLVVTTNYTTSVVQEYTTTFANVVVNHYYSNTPAILQTIATGVGNGYPYGSPLTSTTNYTRITLNSPSGDYYVLPQFGGTNLCGSGIFYAILTNVVYTTNLITSAATNAITAVGTGAGTTYTNAGYSYTQSLITWYTNYVYVAYPVTCAATAGAPAMFQGIGHVQFVREDYDSLLGQFIAPVTFAYTMTYLTNSSLHTANFTRTVAAPGWPLTPRTRAWPTPTTARCTGTSTLTPPRRWPAWPGRASSCRAPPSPTMKSGTPSGTATPTPSCTTKASSSPASSGFSARPTRSPRWRSPPMIGPPTPRSSLSGRHQHCQPGQPVADSDQPGRPAGRHQRRVLFPAVFRRQSNPVDAAADLVGHRPPARSHGQLRRPAVRHPD